MRIVSGTAIMLTIITLLPHFFAGIEKREGVVLNDRLLAMIPPHNVSILIFIIIWGTGALTVIRAVYKPEIYIHYVWTLIFVCIVRMICISMVALNPPVGLIPLADPLTGIFYGEASITKDLFFSGHIASVTIVFLCLEKRNDKIIAFIAIFITAALLVIQHIHYTIDIIASPVITYACYWFAKRCFFKA